MIGNHLQNNEPDWTQAVIIVPTGTPEKAVDRGDMLRTAKEVNPGVITILRHHYDTLQHYDGSPYTVLLDRAKNFFNSFVDGTFARDFASYVDVIETWNETLANSQTPQERQWRVDQERAFCEVWYSEFRPLYPHIKLCLANTAVGNDIPLGIAQLSQQYGYYLGYHNYIATYKPDSVGEVSFGLDDTGTGPSFREKPRYQISPDSLLTGEYLMGSVAFAPPVIGEPSPGEWAWASGRFATMDAAYKAQGVTVWKWLLTESGPVRDANGSGWLDPQGGWRMLGDSEKYWSLLKYWLDQASVWNKNNGNRLKGSVLFTTGGGNAWEWFETKMPEMKMIAERVRAYAPVEPEPPPMIPVIPLNQRDPRWANVPMGEGKTIGNWGCLLACYNALANYWKLCDENPDAHLTRMQNAGAMTGPYMNAGALKTTFPTRVKYLGFENRNPDIRANIIAHLNKGNPVPARVDFNPLTTGQWEQHWVLLVGYTADDFMMVDPWHGDVAPVGLRYNIPGPDNNILEALYYELVAIPDPIPPVTVKHTIYLLPQDTTRDELAALTAQLHPSRSAFTYSADVVHAVMWHGSEGSKVVVVEGHRWSGDIYAWMSDRGIFYTMMDFPE